MGDCPPQWGTSGSLTDNVCLVIDGTTPKFIVKRCAPASILSNCVANMDNICYEINMNAVPQSCKESMEKHPDLSKILFFPNWSGKVCGCNTDKCNENHSTLSTATHPPNPTTPSSGTVPFGKLELSRLIGILITVLLRL